jgi:copper chaperone CopZ
MRMIEGDINDIEGDISNIEGINTLKAFLRREFYAKKRSNAKAAKTRFYKNGA